MPISLPGRSRYGRLALVALLTGLLAAACGGDDDESTSADAVPASGDAADPSLGAGDGAAGAPADAVVEVTAVDFAFEGLPDTVPAGTRLTLANDAPSELHELVAFRLPDDEHRPVAELMALPEAELGPLLGAAPPATVLLAAPGGDQVAAVGDGTLTEAGRYLVMCSIPTGVAPDEYLAAAAASGDGPPDVPGGPPHFAHGMVAELTVT